MNAYIKKMFSDWKTYAMIIGTVMMVFVDCQDRDYRSAVWVILLLRFGAPTTYFRLFLPNIAELATDMKS